MTAVPTVGGKPAVAEYPYCDECGLLLYIVARYPGDEGGTKTFRQYRPDGNGGWIGSLDGVRRVPYRLPRVLAHLEANTTEPLFVVEGERDVEAIEAAGGTATCNPGGAGKWKDDFSEQLAGARRVVVVADRDDPGIRHARAVAASLARVGVTVEIVQAAIGKDAADHLEAGRSLADFRPLAVAEPEADQPAESGGMTGPHSWQPVDLIASGTAPPTPPSIGGLIYPGHRHLILGEPESLKSWLALVLAVDLIRAGRTVVCIDLESTPRDHLARLHDLGLDDQEIAEHFIYLQPTEPIGTGSAAADLHALTAHRQPALIVVDAMIGALSLHALDPDKARDIETFYRVLIDPLIEHGAAVAILDHVTKNRESRGKWATGSERKIGRVDVALALDVVHPFGRGRTGHARVTVSKDRPGYLARPRAADLELTSDADTGAITWTIRLAAPGADTGSFRPTVLMERASRHLETQAAPVSRRNIQDNVGGNAKALRLALDLLIAEEYVEQTPGIRGAYQLRLGRPYREADDPSATTATKCDLSATETHPTTTATTATNPLQGVAVAVALTDELEWR